MQSKKLSLLQACCLAFFQFISPSIDDVQSFGQEIAEISAISVSPGGELLAVVDTIGNLTVLKADSLQELWHFSNNGIGAYAVKFLSSDHFLVGRQKGGISEWKQKADNSFELIKTHSEIFGERFVGKLVVPDSKSWVANASNQVWISDGCENPKELYAFQHRSGQFSISRDSKVLAIGESAGGKLELFRVQDGSIERQATYDFPEEYFLLVGVLEFDSKGTRILVELSHRTSSRLWIFDVASGDFSEVLIKSESAVLQRNWLINDAMFSPDGRFIIVSWGNAIDVIDTESRQLLMRLSTAETHVRHRCLAASQLNSVLRVFSGGTDGKLYSFSVPSFPVCNLPKALD